MHFLLGHEVCFCFCLETVLMQFCTTRLQSLRSSLPHETLKDICLVAFQQRCVVPDFCFFAKDVLLQGALLWHSLLDGQQVTGHVFGKVEEGLFKRKKYNEAKDDQE